MNNKATNEETSKEPEGKENLCIEYKNEAEKNLAGWKRAMADYENLHKRVSEERILARKEGIESSLSSLLVVLDYFNAAFTTIPNEISDNSWVKGVQNIQKAFLDALLNQGIEPIDQINVPFDPSIHEAVEHVQDDNIKIGNVASIISAGYRRENKTIRPAKVRVSNGKATQETDNLGPPVGEDSKENEKNEEKNNLIN